MGGCGDDSDSGDLFAELDAAEARLASEKARERFERLRSGRGFRNDEDELQHRQFIESRIEQLEHEEHEELQKLAEEDLANRNPYAFSHHWLANIRERGHKDWITEVSDQRGSWLASLAKATREIQGEDQTHHSDDERRSTEHEEVDDNSDLCQSEEEEDPVQIDSDDERLLTRALGGASTIRRRFDHVLKKQIAAKATQQLGTQDQEIEAPIGALVMDDLGDDSPNWTARPLTSTIIDGGNTNDGEDDVLLDAKSTKESTRDTEHVMPLAELALFSAETQLPSFAEVERELLETNELPSVERFIAEVDSCGNEPNNKNDRIEADRASFEKGGRPSRRKGLFSRRVEEAYEESVKQVATSSSSTDGIVEPKAEADIGSLIAPPIDSGVPGIGALLSAIDRDLQQDLPDVDSRDLFFQLGKVKKGDWSSSDEELSDRETARSSFQPVQEEIEKDLSASEEEDATENAEDSQISEEDRPGRFIHSSLTAMQARQKRKEQLREITKQRYVEAFAAAACQRHRGIIGGRAGGGSAGQSTGASAARPKKATAMPRSQTIGYASSSGWSFGPGLSFSTDP